MTHTLNNGYNKYLVEDDARKMLLDVGVLKLQPGTSYDFTSGTKEKALLLWSGKVKVHIGKNTYTLERDSIWIDPPVAIHVSRNDDMRIVCLEVAEMVLQAKTNERVFAPKLYDRSNCKVTLAGNNYKPSTSVRQVVDIFNYDNAPYSNMVLGEVIAQPGHWSGYPPHNHNQPEVYIYRFDKAQGFGIGLAGDKAKVVRNYDPIYIPGGKMHQNACAPGYQMYFTWMIPHLPNNPWSERHYAKEHEWINADGLELKAIKELKA